MESGCLYIISTPIGNLEDITWRAVRILSSVDVLACEDTRITKKIFAKYSLELPNLMFSYHEHNEENSGKGIIKILKEGRDVALCADSGSPGISDPGYRIISEVHEQNLKIEVIPGATALIAGLVISGLSTSSFTFKGFPPKKSGQRKRFIEVEKEQPHTLVFYESPYRIVSFLKDAYDVLGNRLSAVCIEITKKFEKVHRGYLQDLIDSLDGKKIKGEITVVISGSNPKFTKINEVDI